MTGFSSILIAVDITLAGLFWASSADEDVMRRLVRKTLAVGLFCLDHRQLQRARENRVRELRRAGPQGRRLRLRTDLGKVRFRQEGSSPTFETTTHLASRSDEKLFICVGYFSCVRKYP